MRGSCIGCRFEAASGEVAMDPDRDAASTTAVTTTTCSNTETMPPARTVLARCGSRGAGSTRHRSGLWFVAGACSVRLLWHPVSIRSGTGAYSWRLSETIPRVEGQEKCHESAGRQVRG